MTDLDYDQARPLFLPSGERLPIMQSRAAIERAYSLDKPVLVYIHGRAKGVGEPKKSVNQGIYDNLSAYGVVTIGFTWDADDGGYDETRPLASVDDFDQLLDALSGFLSSSDGAGKARPALLAHSMGNLIVSELAKDGRLMSDRGNLFTNIVLNAAAVKTKRHHRWLSKLEVSERTYIMINPDDRVLGFAGALFKPDMLGRELRSPGVSQDQAIYVDLGRLGVNHRYFVSDKQNGQGHLNTFFRESLNGLAVNLDAISDAGSIDGVGVRSIRRT